ncbi:hypothetical protein T4B_5764 [Trichinella pseudospiralis]|uniref:FLYWCH-type domain-containing protein n=2 Tax=Trichinella pseudospiralis TaxID=6337 RepID=A0A0V0XVF9_TRIPS|nr:hypothetical protein T4E_7043 [Trichinella pseudospiralis]KRY65163.1 hypothetical protein T4A_137 [Trichinella pseudospiralis]KRY81229.1 hypothetical protein T4D_4624 [Trichinella pseudospiralis]KRZ25116.1 hypothetical protein T4C_7183 [Trichinella pseudospiralis]KRZ31768.1 hypothetical protein T4B_5764 [Trichinella pseudospiralis]
MADISDLRLVANRRGGMSIVYESRAYILRYTGKRMANWGCSKVQKWLTTNMDMTAVLKRTPHSDDCMVDEHIAHKMEKWAKLLFIIHH